MLVADAFEDYQLRFREITRRARQRFESRDWHGMQEDARRRLLLYGRLVERTLREVERALKGSRDPAAGARIKAAYARRCEGRPDIELAETFFNSVIRRAFRVVGVDRALEFVGEGVDDPPAGGAEITRAYPVTGALAPVLRRVVSDLPLGTPFADLERDAALAARAITAEPGLGADGAIEGVEVLAPLFYRNKGAYLVGRIARRDGFIPLVLALLHDTSGITVDAVLLTPDEASVVFGFTRSYFHVEVERPRKMIEFLRTLMPHRRVDELYTAIGYNRHGKTELYRTLMRHLETTDARFEPAPGVKGMVMSVFTLPSFNVVFKVIKDRFGHPKRATRRAVMDKYHFIFVRDRVGRLADAQEFERLELRRACFSEEVLAELRGQAARTVAVDGERVVIEHLYTERRVTPLNLYLGSAGRSAAVDAVLDYGNAIKDLAAANIFPGDLLLKNFGVTRHGRIIFYDYDEVEDLTTCNFRELPQARCYEDELSDAPWFPVREHDVFPEEFPRFLGLPPGLDEAFRQAHGDLFTIRFWQEMQSRQRAGEVVDFFPYRQSRRLSV